MKTQLMILALAAAVMAQEVATTNTVTSADRPLTLRSNAYGAVLQGITASDDGIADLTTRPYLAGGKQLIAIEAGNNASAHAALIMNLMGGNALAQFKATPGQTDIAEGQFGWATAQGNMGASLFWGENTSWEQSKDSASGPVNGLRQRDLGNMWGLGGGVRLSSLEFFGTFRWANIGDGASTESITYQDDKDVSYQLANRSTTMLGARNVQGPAIWDIRYSLINDNFDTKSGTPAKTTKRRTVGHVLSAEIGQAIPTQVQELKPYIGLGLIAALNDPKLGYRQELAALAKVGVEYQLFANWRVMGGYTFTEAFTKTVTDGTLETYESERTTPWSRGVLGVTYHKGALSIETMLTPQVSDDGPSSFFSGSDVLASTAAIWNF